jgi:protein-disulfide isomerase
MSKRQEIRARRQRQKMMSRLFVIGMVVLGALLIAGALALPSINNAQNASATATSGASSPVIVVTPRVINVAVDGTHLGDPRAPVKVDIYTDFRCSACAYYTQSVEPIIIQTYVETGIVYYSFHSFIVIDSYDNSSASYNSALAAECAADQNLFWEYHDTLYANQVTEAAALYSNERLVQMAQNVGLNMDTFNQCFSNKVHQDIVQGDISEGRLLGITSTPSIFVNGVLTPYNQLTTAIEAARSGK